MSILYFEVFVNLNLKKNSQFILVFCFCTYEALYKNSFKLCIGVLFFKNNILLIPGPALFNSSITGNLRIKWRKVDWWISNVPPVCNRTRQFLFCPMRCPRFWDATANQHVRNLRISEFLRSHWSSARHRYSVSSTVCYALHAAGGIVGHS